MRILDIFASPEQSVSPGVQRWRRILPGLCCFLGGTLYAAALPPFNLFFLAAASLLPLLYFVPQKKILTAFFYGWLWGLGWALFSFQFLREIEFIVPYLMAPVIALWPGVFAGIYSQLARYTLSIPSRKRILLSLFGAAVLFVLLEWTRSRLFTWNDFSVPLWRLPVMLQIAALTGHYGVNFTVALANCALAALLIYRKKSVFFLLLLPILASAGYGTFKLLMPSKGKTMTFSPALIQGNLSQRRRATLPQSREALDTYVSATEKLLKKGPTPDVVIWPEGAIPIPFYSTLELSFYNQNTEYGRLAAAYQFQVKRLSRQYNVPLLIGALDFDKPFSAVNKNPGSTNSALLFDNSGTLKNKYDKFHRVPFGEYIPFRFLLPEILIKYIDMGRDLVPGKNLTPVPLTPALRAGTAICYEGVFSYVTRAFAQKGANVFIVLSNDAWYPRSSEPEQHLANAVLRAVETGLPMIRCGNNGGSGVVYPDGRFKILDPTGRAPRPELLRCAAAEILPVQIPVDPPKTFYVRYGEWFIWLLLIFLAGWLAFAFREYRSGKKISLENTNI